MRAGISRTVIATGVCGALLTAPSVAGAADAIYGLTDNNRLVRFNSDSPSEAQQILAVQGLQQGETLVGIDTRAQNDTLYAVGTTNRVYQVNPVTGAARPAFGPFSLGLNGASFGIDVNPVADSLRIVSDAEQNLRVAFVGGDAGAAQAEGALQYAAGDPGAGTDPSVGAAAYTNSVPGASQTTLYDIDTARDVLVRQDPPGAGTLVTVGALGFDAREPAGFDVSPQGNVAYAALERQGKGQGVTLLYRVDLNTGRATAVRPSPRIATPRQLRGIAVVTGAVPDDRVAPKLSVAFSSTILEHNTDVLKPSVSCNETCAIAVIARVAGRVAGRGGAVLGTAGRVTVEVPLRASARLRIAREGTELISLRVAAVDAAGNRRERNRISRTQTLAERRAG